MAKPELGTKRQCASCNAKFYDLNKDPIVCPKCGTVFEVVSIAPIVDEDPELDPTAPEMVSLDEVAKAEKGAGDISLDDDLDVDDDLDDDDTFLEEEEEGDSDVSDLIDNDLDEDEDN
ncbi:TIGR02300 family protein [Microvirga sp. W0021]|uniref:TIGR02300 family protein n=1 Tax=Hohaiivirga grylli TaxID=3133970 RepID=A0ABV0BG72_9HYPH